MTQTSVRLQHRHGRLITLLTKLRLSPTTPKFRRFNRTNSLILPRLVTTQHARRRNNSMNILSNRFQHLTNRFVTRLCVLRFILTTGLVRLVRLRPRTFQRQTVRLDHTSRQTIRTVSYPLRHLNRRQHTILTRAQHSTRSSLFMTSNRVTLRHLARINSLTQALIRRGHLVRRVPFRIFTSMVRLKPRRFRRLRTVITKHRRLIRFTRALVRLTDNFTSVNFQRINSPTFRITQNQFAR